VLRLHGILVGADLPAWPAIGFRNSFPAGLVTHVPYYRIVVRVGDRTCCLMEKPMNQQNGFSTTQAPRADDSAVAQVLDMLRGLEAKLENMRSLLTERRKEHFTIGEFAQIVGRSPYTARRWVSEGKVSAIRVQGCGPRGRLLVPRCELDRLIRAGQGGDIPETALA
jgi:hypothetical protein